MVPSTILYFFYAQVALLNSFTPFSKKVVFKTRVAAFKAMKLSLENLYFWFYCTSSSIFCALSLG